MAEIIFITVIINFFQFSKVTRLYPLVLQVFLEIWTIRIRGLLVFLFFLIH